MKHKIKQKHLEDKYSIKTARMSRGPCNTQEDTPQHQSPAEAVACSQVEGERPDFAKCFIRVFSPLKSLGLDKEGPWNTQDDATLPKSTRETAACSQTPRAKSAISEPFLCDFSQSKRPRLDEDAKMDSPEDALQRSHKAVAITQPETESKASSSDSVIFISSTDKGNGAENHISQDNVLQPDSTVEDPASNFPAAEHSGFSEHLISLSTIIKRPRLDEDAKLDSPEDALQRSHKAVAITQPETESKASSSDSVIFISSTDKGNGAENHISQDNVLQPDSTVEDPASNFPAAEHSGFSEHLISLSTIIKRPRLDEDAKLDSPEDALQRSHKAVAITQPETESKVSSSDSVIFISSTDKGNGAEHRISQDNVPQPDSPVEAPSCSHPVGEKSGFSEHLIGVSTPIKRPRLDDDDKEYTGGT
uniref:Uncharacterized protein n=1 Tax=Pipistrellus kuhlii TaxID=59472 RepID=A0A7J8B1D7_PIPKU|nr:hypothetical protein mPipKuh1_007796 [Pipistrellus kuhlii]